LVNADFARNRKMLIKKRPSEVIFRVANNKTIEVSGATELEVKLGGTPIHHEYVVAEGLVHNIILGADVLILGSKRLTFCFQRTASSGIEKRYR